MDVGEFTNLPRNVRLHRCCIMYLKANNVKPYVNGKPCKTYWTVRAYLKKQSDMAVRNIAVMLDEMPYSCDIYTLAERAKRYVSNCYTKSAKKKLATVKSGRYKIDLRSFLLEG